MAKKQTIKLIIILAVLCIVIAAYVGIKKHNEKEEEEQVSSKPSYSVTSIDTESIQSFNYTYNGKTYTLEKDSSGKWTYKEDKSVKIDADQVTTLLSSISNVTSEVQITDVTDMEQYGLDKPANVITLNTKDSSIVINIGDCNTSTGDYYARLGDEKTVYTVNSVVGTKFNVPATDLVAASSTQPAIDTQK